MESKLSKVLLESYMDDIKGSAEFIDELSFVITFDDIEGTRLCEWVKIFIPHLHVGIGHVHARYDCFMRRECV